MPSEIQCGHTYSGLINQEEFKRRYAFIKARINSGYSQEDVAFLLGKPPYFIKDYEELNGASKLILEDLAILSIILTNLYPEIIPFDPDETGENEKRVVRGVYKEVSGVAHYTFTHPWTVAGVNAKITVAEKLFCPDDTEKAQMVRSIYQRLTQLIEEGCLNAKCPPLFIYQEVKKQISSKKGALKPSLLIPAIYSLIAEKRIKMLSDRSRLSYQAAHFNTPVFRNNVFQ